MLAEVVNIVYGVVIFVYAFPFVATMLLPELEAEGLVETIPAWINDTTWKGFWLSPFRMVKEFIA